MGISSTLLLGLDTSWLCSLQLLGVNSTTPSSVGTWNTPLRSQLLYVTWWCCLASCKDSMFAMLWELCLTVKLSKSPISLVLVDLVLHCTVTVLFIFLMFVNSTRLAIWSTILWLSSRSHFLSKTPLSLICTNIFCLGQCCLHLTFHPHYWCGAVPYWQLFSPQDTPMWCAPSCHSCYSSLLLSTSCFLQFVQTSLLLWSPLQHSACPSPILRVVGTCLRWGAQPQCSRGRCSFPLQNSLSYFILGCCILPYLPHST